MRRLAVLLVVLQVLLVPGAGSAAEPGQVVKEAFDLLMDRFVMPPSSAPLLNAAWDAGYAAVVETGATGLPEGRPALTGDRAADWRAFAERYARLSEPVAPSMEQWQLDRAAIQGMAASLNSHDTQYLAPEQVPGGPAQRQYGGVGMASTGPSIVFEVFPGGPAEAAGLRVGDQVIAVDGASVEGATAEDVATRIRGPVGTRVDLAVRRGQAELITVSLIRAEITLDWVAWSVLESNIGRLRLRSFAQPEALGSFQAALDGLAAAEVQGLVIDLRGNRGGYFETLRQAASRFIRQGPIWQQTNRAGQQQTVMATGGHWGRSVPITVLVNNVSFSQSELLAAALREQGVARVIGTPTVGRVAGGNVFPLSDGSRLVVTTLIVRSGQGTVSAGVGVQPDRVVEFDPGQRGGDVQLEAALEYIRQAPR